MVQLPKLSRRARWAVPAGALVVTGGVLAGSLISVAQAAPGLPARTPAQLLVQVADSAAPPLTGTVVETASFGLPRLPGNQDPTSLASLLTGSHTVRVWYSGPRRFRLAVPEPLSESDVFRDGSTAWLWRSTANSVTEFSLPAGHATPASPPVPALTPQQAAQQVLAAVGKTTVVSVDRNAVVAGRAAYELVLAPRDSRSLVGQVQIAIDGQNAVPLRLQVFARGAGSPAFQVGYTYIRFVAPSPGDVSFTPPPGAKLTKVNLAGRDRAAPGSGNADVSAFGSGWLTVLDLPSSGLTAEVSPDGGPVSIGNAPGDSAAVINALLKSATTVSGTWGRGRLLRTSLISALITGNGRMFVGAVQPSVLYTAAAQAAAAPAGTP